MHIADLASPECNRYTPRTKVHPFSELLVLYVQLVSHNRYLKVQPFIHDVVLSSTSQVKFPLHVEIGSHEAAGVARIKR